MNRRAFKKRFSIGWQGMCSSRFALVLTIALGCLIAPLARAQLTTFAQFFERGGNSAFSYISSGTAGAGGSATLSTASVAIYFQYMGFTNLPADLAGIQDAHLAFSSFTTLGPTAASSGFSEIFNGSGVNSAMITITRDTPAAEGNGSQTILLQAVFTPFAFSGSGGSGGFSASSFSGTVTFTSDFLGFQDSAKRDLALAFSSINPALSIGGNGFFNSFTAAGTGTFSSDSSKNIAGSGPTLNIHALPGAVQLSWTTNAVGYVLETNNALTLPAGWGVLTSNFNVVATSYVVTNSTTGAGRFYRLHKP
jgi:hypothetical protein